MTADVVYLPGSETVEQFLQRRGEATTIEVAARFGWGPLNALRHLAELRFNGAVDRREGRNLDGSATNIWSIA